jgi:ATP-dependent Clp protease ATP-binding subunit ClpB
LKYGKLRELESQLKEMNQKLVDLQKQGRILKEEIDENDVAEVVSKWSGIPVHRMLESEAEKLLRMEEELHKRVVGQDEAISAVANAIRRNRAGISAGNRPIGSFIFLGPTGVGKTELAKTLTQFLFNTEKALIRLDMSEYMERHAVAKLVGAPPGYVGYEEGGQLTEAVRRKPYSVILFDEIEKAHRDVFNILLQILDDGRLTDAQGRTVDFTNTVIIMTSNIGSEEIFRAEKDEDLSRPIIMQALQSYFRPEFLNRVDEIIIFHRLTQEHMVQITQIQLSDLRNRMVSRGIKLEITPKVVQYLAGKGYDPQFGARPLKRLIQKEVEDKIAVELLKVAYDQAGMEGSIGRISVDLQDGNIVIKTEFIESEDLALAEAN